MTTVTGSVSGSVAGSDGHKRMRFGSVEPALLALLKQLDPLIAAATLFACQFAWGESPTPTSAAIGLLAFIVSSRIFDRREVAGVPLSKSYSRILLEWSSVVAILLFLGFAFKVTAGMGCGRRRQSSSPFTPGCAIATG